jgi:N-acyl-D-aspartate/D-glutamate deacylase
MFRSPAVMALAVLTLATLSAQTYDTVVLNGRVIDPESKLDAIRNLGITGGKVRAVSAQPLKGKTTIDASGLVVAPGFIDLHWHGVDPASDRYEAMDGVTASFELEIGVADVDQAYAAREGRSLIHHGFAASDPAARMIALAEAGARIKLLPTDEAASQAATPEQISEMKRLLEAQLKRGAVAVGFGLAYTPAASYLETIEMFRVAARFHASCHVHVRGAGPPGAPANGRVQGVSEVIAAAAITGAPLQIVHINSTGMEAVGDLLGMVEGARARGLDITTEAYPYTAGATEIQSALFANWDSRPDADFQTLQWIATGERLTRETFRKYRQQGGTVIIHGNTQERVRMAILSPLTMIASDGFDVKPGQGHPRSAGTYTRILAKYVREDKLLSLSDAIRKMSLMPAQRLEGRVPSMKNKGRIRIGSDADLAIFDPATVNDRATYEHPDEFSEGMRFVLVDGVPVIHQGQLVGGVFPGRGVRAPMDR